jgi:GNAT superfamily N-acetyltransferase
MATQPHASALSWRTLNRADLDAVRALAKATLDVDGGLPMLLEDGLLQTRLFDDHTTAAFDAGGQLLAVAAVRGTEQGVDTSGLVHPQVRGRGLGRRLMAWAADYAGGRALTVQTECCSPGAERLYTRFGLRQVFAELVMRHDLGVVNDIEAPAGIAFVEVAACSHDALFAAYTNSFADRPSFRSPAQSAWVDGLAGDTAWNQLLSRVAFDGPTPVAFVNVVGTWIDQVGVVPAHRGRGVGTYLVVQALTGLAASGADQAWLTVEIANPAADLYRSLGFRYFGKRARFA